MDWNPQCEEALDQMMDTMKENIKHDAEEHARFIGQETVDALSLEIALYKSVMTLNETNKAVIFKKLGPQEGTTIINELEYRARTDVTRILLEDVMKKYDDFPPHIQKAVDKIKKLLDSGQEFNPDELKGLFGDEEDNGGLF